jgi:uncharacterized protein DUF4349
LQCILFADKFSRFGEQMNSLTRIIPIRSPILWKGIGLGLVASVAVLALAIPNLMRSKIAAHDERMLVRLDTVEADGPKIVRKAQLDLIVGNCAETQKKIETIAAAETGFVESSALEESSARMTLRVPSERLEAVRAKLRGLALRVRQDSVTAADVSKQYFDGEARLRNLRAEEQQFLDVMKKAHTVPDILAVTKSLSEVREEIETADADFRHLKDQVEMAQIDVNLSSQVTSAIHWSAGSSTKAAFNDFLQSLATIADFVIWLVVNIPVIALWAVLIFLLVAVSWYVLRTVARIMKRMFGKKPGPAEVPAKP